MTEERKTCFLIAVSDRPDAEASLRELELLAKTAGLECVGVSSQTRTRPDPATYIGAGKAAELKNFIAANDVSLVIADSELTAGQIRNLEDALDCPVIDRTVLILDIFAGRARSSEGRLQVELAQLQYRLPRLAGMGDHLSRLGGGIGTRGPGETKLETDRRHIRRRIKALSDSLEEVRVRRQTARRGRLRGGAPSVALVGYTNAGKSTLMNRLCESDVYVKDQLFATLDPTVRKIVGLPGRDILLSDTVGFLRNLPHTLIDAFRSTLEESLCADLLLLVADASDPEAAEQIAVVRQLLTQLGADGKNLILVLNKCDLCDRFLDDRTPLLFAAAGTNLHTFPVSAKTGEGCDALKNAILRFFAGEEEETVVVPFGDGAKLAEIYRERVVLRREDGEDGIRLTVCKHRTETEV